MSATSNEEKTYQYQTEVKRVLDLVIHSLYSNKEIFLRELISNASDALDKLRFLSISEPSRYPAPSELKIEIDFDSKDKVIRISDNGIGMSAEEMVEHLGTIAKSGTHEFLSQLSGNQKKDSQLIGQFGVGFYSSFIVADRVKVISRRTDLPANQAAIWSSDGSGHFTMTPTELAQGGTTVELHLKEDEISFLDHYRLRHLVEKYSDHVPFPIYLAEAEETAEEVQEGEERSQATAKSMERVNQATAIWLRAKSEVKDEDYIEFYKHVSHDFQDPLTWNHAKVEGKTEYSCLLYIPKTQPFGFQMRDKRKGLKLYVKRIFIMDDAEQFLPNYLRFVSGVLDCNDLPLNVSRELLQNNRMVETIKQGLVQRVLATLTKLSQDDPEKYKQFWEQFGTVLKEGIVEDFQNRETIAKLLRFNSTHSTEANYAISLDSYLTRLKPDQNKIYYLTADQFVTGLHSPQLEIFKKNSIEVLLLTDPIDEWLVGHLTEYQGKSLCSVSQGDLEGAEFSSSSENSAHEELQPVLEQIKQCLTEQIKEVRWSKRLTDSPSCLVGDSQDMSQHLQKILKSMGQTVSESKPILELNGNHPMVQALQSYLSSSDHSRFQDLSFWLLEQAQLSSGFSLKDPAEMVARLNRMVKL